MIATVMKHEWLRTRWFVLATWAVAAVCIAVTSAMAATGWAMFTAPAFGIGLSVLSTMVVSTLVQLGVDYWRSSYGPIGYGTQTLPIRGRVIVVGKLLNALLVMVATLLVAVALGLLLWAGIGGVGKGLHTLGRLLSTAVPWWGWIVGAAVLLLTVLNHVVLVFFAVSFGVESRMQRLGAAGPIVTWVAAYLGTQLMGVVGMLLPLAIGVDQTGRLGWQSTNLIAWIRENDQASSLPVGFLAGMLLVAIAMVCRTVISWEHKTSLAS